MKGTKKSGARRPLAEQRKRAALPDVPAFQIANLLNQILARL